VQIDRMSCQERREGGGQERGDVRRVRVYQEVSEILWEVRRCQENPGGVRKCQKLSEYFRRYEVDVRCQKLSVAVRRCQDTCKGVRGNQWMSIVESRQVGVRVGLRAPSYLYTSIILQFTV